MDHKAKRHTERKQQTHGGRSRGNKGQGREEESSEKADQATHGGEAICENSDC